MSAKNVFRDDALLASTQPERLDGLVRVEPPHQFVVTRLTAVLAVLVFAWLGFGTTDHSLWLDAVPAEKEDATGASSVLDGEDGSRAVLLAFVSARYAEALAPGMRADLVTPGGPAGRGAAGTVLSVSSRSGEIPLRIVESGGNWTGPSLVVRVAVPARALADEDATDGLQRLRIPLGRQSLLRFMTRQLLRVTGRGGWELAGFNDGSPYVVQRRPVRVMSSET